ncbi:MAG: hypothetical protein NTZ95_08585 [Candidatus Omnitrophica bacterium]|nr:hypothetical protein [Candidatus Omnitrophota bacterium]
MGTSRIKEAKMGFGKRNTRMSVAERKKVRRLMVRAIVKKLETAGKSIDLQAINREVLDKCCRKRQSQKPKHGTQIVR